MIIALTLQLVLHLVLQRPVHFDFAEVFMLAPPLLVFTDLDGTLLDHETYSHADAAPMLDVLRRHGAPVMPTTSKTRAEVEVLRAGLGNTDPFIVENGAAAYLPRAMFQDKPAGASVDATEQYWVMTWTEPRVHWQRKIEQLAPQFEGMFATFYEADLSEIVAWTGLSEDDAARAQEREFGEPVRWLGDEASAQEFSSRLSTLGANVLRGGRFFHVSGSCDKGLALLWIRDQFQELHGIKGIPTLAAGDSPNDIGMLEAADYAVIVRSSHDLAPDLQPHPCGSERRVFTRNTGPRGWAEGVAQLANPLLL